jgi:tetratricopeptide (TPR) repeat protein
LKKALEIDPNYFNACCNLAALFSEQGRFDEAIALLERAYTVDAERAKLWFLRDEKFESFRSDPRFAFLVTES